MTDSSKRLPVADTLVDVDATASACLSEVDLMDFARGELDADARERADHHIDRCDRCCRLLNEAVHAINSSHTSRGDGEGSDWATTFRPGAVVAERYEIRRFIARGGMGEVYEAYDRVLQERVALKTVASTVCDSQRAIRNLMAEVKLALRVTHPNVCRIHGLGTHEPRDGAPALYFLTMEFVDGETLGKLIRRTGPLPLAEAQAFATALLGGLSAAHSAGILHRDFKSDNVLLRTGPDGRRTPVILDFGLARTLDERSRARTSNQAFVGTLTYMAPEQVEGTNLSRATDIYAFGVVWFEMLTGKLPFRGTPQMSALERLSKAPAVPSQVDPSVPRALDAVVLRCLRRLPSQRFQTADAVLAAMPTLDFDAAPRKPARRVLQIGVALCLVLTVSYFSARASTRNEPTSALGQASSNIEASRAATSAVALQPQRPPPQALSQAAAHRPAPLLHKAPSVTPAGSSRSSRTTKAPKPTVSAPRRSASAPSSPTSFPSAAAAAPASPSRKWNWSFPMAVPSARERAPSPAPALRTSTSSHP